MKVRGRVVGEAQAKAKMRAMKGASTEALATGMLAGGEVIRAEVVLNLRRNGLWVTGNLARSVRVERVS